MLRRHFARAFWNHTWNARHGRKKKKRVRCENVSVSLPKVDPFCRTILKAASGSIDLIGLIWIRLDCNRTAHLEDALGEARLLRQLFEILGVGVLVDGEVGLHGAQLVVLERRPHPLGALPSPPKKNQQTNR